MLEVFLEQVRSNRVQVVPQHVTQANSLIGGEVLLTLEDAPARFLEDRCVAVPNQLSRFRGPHLVNGLVYFRDDVKSVQDIQCIDAALANDPQVWLPHV